MSECTPHAAIKTAHRKGRGRTHARTSSKLGDGTMTVLPEMQPMGLMSVSSSSNTSRSLSRMPLQMSGHETLRSDGSIPTYARPYRPWTTSPHGHRGSTAPHPHPQRQTREGLRAPLPSPPAHLVLGSKFVRRSNHFTCNRALVGSVVGCGLWMCGRWYEPCLKPTLVPAVAPRCGADLG